MKCRYCGWPIKKVLIGWVHRQSFSRDLADVSWHVAKPGRQR